LAADFFFSERVAGFLAVLAVVFWAVAMVFNPSLADAPVFIFARLPERPLQKAIHTAN
jgi:hypothetical protein